MIPLWPSINPSLIGSLMNNNGASSVTEEQEVSALESEQQAFLNLVETIGNDVVPLGKTEQAGGEDSDADSAAASDDQESESSDHESEVDNDERESFTVNY